MCSRSGDMPPPLVRTYGRLVETPRPANTPQKAKMMRYREKTSPRIAPRSTIAVQDDFEPVCYETKSPGETPKFIPQTRRIIMHRRYDNTHRITAAQRTACNKLVAQTAKLVNVIGEAVTAGLPQEDCYALVQHMASHCQEPLPQEIHPAMAAAVERVHTTMGSIVRHMSTVAHRGRVGRF